MRWLAEANQITPPAARYGCMTLSGSYSFDHVPHHSIYKLVLRWVSDALDFYQLLMSLDGLLGSSFEVRYRMGKMHCIHTTIYCIRIQLFCCLL